MVISRKFSIIRKRIIGFETPTPPLHTSMTDGIELSKLRKPNQRFAFLKFTYFLPRNRVCANNTDISCGSKLQFLFANEQKQLARVLPESSAVICAKFGGVSTNSTATLKKLFEVFRGLRGRFFKKAPYILLKLSPLQIPIFKFNE